MWCVSSGNIRGDIIQKQELAFLKAFKAVFGFEKLYVIKFCSFCLCLFKKIGKKTCRPLDWPPFQRLSWLPPPSSFFPDVWTYNSKSIHTMKKCRTAKQSWQFLRSIAVYYVFVAITLLELSLISYKTRWKVWSKTQQYLVQVYKKHSHIFTRHITKLL